MFLSRVYTLYIAKDYLKFIMNTDNERLTADKRKAIPDDDGSQNNKVAKVQVPKEEEDVKQHGFKNLDNFQLVEVLNENKGQKNVFIHAKVNNDDAVVIMEKKPFPTTSEALSLLLSDGTSLEKEMKNDIYGLYSALPDNQFSTVKATVIHPATKKHINKYRAQQFSVFSETAQDYTQITKPYLEKQISSNVFSLQWVYNILEGKAEADRVLYKDTDPDKGFMLVMDLKWNGKDPKTLYCTGIPFRRDLKSIRDLTKDHLPLLENIRDQSVKVLSEKYSVDQSKLRTYFHYQPSYYHLHMHFNHIECEMPGTDAWRAHLLNDVIENIKLFDDYYQKKTLTFMLKENDLLSAALKYTQ